MDDGKPDLERDLKASEAVADYCISKYSADLLYAALCNRPWRHTESGETWSCSWRYAGGLVAEIRGEGDYIDHYCAGGEGFVPDDVAALVAPLGWEPLSDSETQAHFSGLIDSSGIASQAPRKT